MFERYTEKARRAIFFARYEASQSGSSYIVPLHLLLGLLRDNSYLFSKAGLRENALEFAETCRRFLPLSDKKISTSVDLPLSDDCRQALTNAAAEADQMDSESITPQHVLLGLIKASSEVSGILKDHGVTADTLAGAEISPPEKPRTPVQGKIYAEIAPGVGSVFIEFIHQGERVGSASALIASPVPRVGDEVVFDRGNESQTFKVLAVKYHFEEPPKSKTPGHARLAKVAVEVEPSET
jgi:hypothetical protein